MGMVRTDTLSTGTVVIAAGSKCILHRVVLIHSGRAPAIAGSQTYEVQDNFDGRTLVAIPIEDIAIAVGPVAINIDTGGSEGPRSASGLRIIVTSGTFSTGDATFVVMYEELPT